MPPLLLPPRTSPMSFNTTSLFFAPSLLPEYVGERVVVVGVVEGGEGENDGGINSGLSLHTD